MAKIIIYESLEDQIRIAIKNILRYLKICKSYEAFKYLEEIIVIYAINKRWNKENNITSIIKRVANKFNVNDSRVNSKIKSITEEYQEILQSYFKKYERIKLKELICLLTEDVFKTLGMEVDK